MALMSSFGLRTTNRFEWKPLQQSELGTGAMTVARRASEQQQEDPLIFTSASCFQICVSLAESKSAGCSLWEMTLLTPNIRIHGTRRPDFFGLEAQIVIQISTQAKSLRRTPGMFCSLRSWRATCNSKSLLFWGEWITLILLRSQRADGWGVSCATRILS